MLGKRKAHLLRCDLEGDALYMQQEALGLQQEIENKLVSRIKVNFEMMEVAK